MVLSKTTKQPRRPAGEAPAALPIAPPPLRRRRRPAFIAAGAALAAVGALVSYQQVESAGSRVAVLAVAHDVPAGQVIAPGDLAVAQVAPDPALKPVPERDRGQIVGRRAAGELLAGSLVTGASVEGRNPLTVGKSVVPVETKAGQVPGGLRPGDAVQLVATASVGDSTRSTGAAAGAMAPIDAVVVDVGPSDTASGGVQVDIAVDPSVAATAASWTQAGSFSLLAQGGS